MILKGILQFQVMVQYLEVGQHKQYELLHEINVSGRPRFTASHGSLDFHENLMDFHDSSINSNENFMNSYEISIKSQGF
jgi:hypothetical protein